MIIDNDAHDATFVFGETVVTWSATNESGNGFYEINMRFMNDINTSKNVYVIKSFSKKEIKVWFSHRKVN